MSIDGYAHRTAQIEDLAAIVAIYNDALPFAHGQPGHFVQETVQSRLTWFHRHSSGRCPIWVADGLLGEMLGWLAFSDHDSHASHEGVAELSIYLREDARGKGLGRYLLRQAIVFAPEAGIHTLLGLISDANRRSLALFESFGFHKWAGLPVPSAFEGAGREIVVVGKRVERACA